MNDTLFFSYYESKRSFMLPLVTKGDSLSQTPFLGHPYMYITSPINSSSRAQHVGPT